MYKLPGTQCNYITCNFHLIIKNETTINWFPEVITSLLLIISNTVFWVLIYETLWEKKCPKVSYLLAMFYGMCQAQPQHEEGYEKSGWYQCWLIMTQSIVGAGCHFKCSLFAQELSSFFLSFSFFFSFLFPSHFSFFLLTSEPEESFIY